MTQSPIELSGVVAYLMERERRANAVEQLCGHILATLVVSQNRERMLEGDVKAVQSLIALSDLWAAEFKKITSSGFIPDLTQGEPR